MRSKERKRQARERESAKLSKITATIHSNIIEDSFSLVISLFYAVNFEMDVLQLELVANGDADIACISLIAFFVSIFLIHIRLESHFSVFLSADARQ